MSDFVHLFVKPEYLPESALLQVDQSINPQLAYFCLVSVVTFKILGDCDLQCLLSPECLATALKV